MSLDGNWEFSFDEPTFDRTIVVPFAYQSQRSGIGTGAHHEALWYRRGFTTPAHADDERVLIHFGAVDFAATVWVDDVEVGRHRGGHTSFCIDVTDALEEGRDVHELRVGVIDEFRPDQLRGKQTTTFPYLVHYTPTSGIWQSVWCEVVGASWIRSSQIVADPDGSITVDLDVAGDPAASARMTIGDDELVVAAEGYSRFGGRLDGVRPWSPAEPNLYDLRLDLFDADGRTLDTVHGHVGFRTLEVGPGRWLLSGEPLHQRLVLDQGYWPESLITPPSEQALIDDLTFVKNCGFDGVRKHQKIEDPRFLWHADRLGLLVWEELPSPFWLTRVEDDLEDDAASEWTEAIVRDRNHPSVIAWVPFNESWGLTDLHGSAERVEVVRRMVALTRSLDPTRPVVDNSGWGHVDTDVVDVHDYDQDPNGLISRWSDIEANGWTRSPQVGGDEPAPERDLDAELARWREFLDPPEDLLANDRWLVDSIPDTRVWVEGCEPEPGTAGPLVLSEIGGVGLVIGEPPRDLFEYSRAQDPDDLLRRFVRIVTAVEQIPEVVGWCWTELSDVEQELNGLLDAERHPKVDPARIAEALAAMPWSKR